MSDLEVISVRPERDQYAWTFGGAAPVARIRPPAVLEVFTEDAFFGNVRSETDLVSQVCEFPYVNPQTGPFYIEGRSQVTPWPCISSPSSRPGTGARPPRSRCSAP
jgi:hypothetical protein